MDAGFGPTSNKTQYEIVELPPGYRFVSIFKDIREYTQVLMPLTAKHQLPLKHNSSHAYRRNFFKREWIFVPTIGTNKRSFVPTSIRYS